MGEGFRQPASGSHKARQCVYDGILLNKLGHRVLFTDKPQPRCTVMIERPTTPTQACCPSHQSAFGRLTKELKHALRHAAAMDAAHVDVRARFKVAGV